MQRNLRVVLAFAVPLGRKCGHKTQKRAVDGALRTTIDCFKILVRVRGLEPPLPRENYARNVCQQGESTGELRQPIVELSGATQLREYLRCQAAVARIDGKVLRVTVVTAVDVTRVAHFLPLGGNRAAREVMELCLARTPPAAVTLTSLLDPRWNTLACASVGAISRGVAVASTVRAPPAWSRRLERLGGDVYAADGHGTPEEDLPPRNPKFGWCLRGHRDLTCVGEERIAHHIAIIEQTKNKRNHHTHQKRRAGHFWPTLAKSMRVLVRMRGLEPPLPCEN